MGKRGPKPQFNDIACLNKDCELYGLTDKGNVIGNGTSVSRGEKVRKYICRHCGKVFNDHTGTVYYDLRKEEHIIDLALKMTTKGMSEKAIADELGIEPATVRRWLGRATVKRSTDIWMFQNITRKKMDDLSLYSFMKSCKS